MHTEYVRKCCYGLRVRNMATMQNLEIEMTICRICGNYVLTLIIKGAGIKLV
jgi:hypothetical protein